MAPSFHVSVLSYRLVEEIEGGWTEADFVRLLEAQDYGDTSGMSPEELREICVRSLQDLPLDEAAALLMRHKLEGALRSGQVENLSHEVADERHWEHWLGALEDGDDAYDAAARPDERASG
ncbi:MAG: hypothetical protein R3F62_08670 [Planctomycetota bacterium]